MSQENTNQDQHHHQRQNPPIQRRPQMYFKLEELVAKDSLARIQQLTSDFDPQYGISPEFIAQLKLSLDNESVIFQGFLYAPNDPVICKKVIGRGGCYFHKTTQQCQIDFIWHDRTNQKFLFWGKKWPLIRALNAIHRRITNQLE
jgi:hypothetical protein